MSNRRQRRPLPYFPSSYGGSEQGSPSKASVLLQQDHAQYIQSLAPRRQTFLTCLDLYKVCFENELPQKCLTHNNFITLFCENDSALMCVNCLYSTALHKPHKVSPSKDLVVKIGQENETNIRYLDEQLERVKGIDVEIKNNKKVLEDEYKNILSMLDGEFVQMRRLLDEKYAEMKQQIIQSFGKASQINEKAIREVAFWKDIYSKTRSTLPKISRDEEAEVYKHLVLSLFMRENIQGEKLTYIPSGAEIKDKFLKQAFQLHESMLQHGGTVGEKPKSKMF